MNRAGDQQQDRQSQHDHALAERKVHQNRIID